MAENEIILEPKLVGEITGKFFVPGYQRGYRWGEDEVTRLLEDIDSNGTQPYCLQPVVVKKNDDVFELIDGQQRLTTLFLIYKYMSKASNGFIKTPEIFLQYETRTKSEEFLNNLELSRKEENIDYWHICNAYETIDKWFNSEKHNETTLINFKKYFDENVKVIWYEVSTDEDSIALFTRLNIGKIPLTSAELVKAMFLCNEGGAPLNEEQKEEIALQWDNIEKELHDESLWCFLTNKDGKKYQTRIDLILNLISERPENCKEKYYTFFKFDEKRKEKPLTEIWREIQHTFLILKEWYEDHELYHKVGYLIASDSVNLLEIFNYSTGKKKTEFRTGLDDYIKESIKINKNYGELEYINKTEYDQISRLLLLFNVESVRQIDEHAQRFPFDKFKDSGKWSLEHIHAQQSEGLKTIEQWREWLKLHLDSLENINIEKDPLIKETLIAEVRNLSEEKVIEKSKFSELQARVIEYLSVTGNAQFLHSISNLALLNQSDNAALNNSTFDVKRNKIVEMDKAGAFIPFATKMVFLKYYTPSKDNQLNFWGMPDRKAYVKAINTVLKEYLEEEIELEKEEE